MEGEKNKQENKDDNSSWFHKGKCVCVCVWTRSLYLWQLAFMSTYLIIPLWVDMQYSVVYLWTLFECFSLPPRHRHLEIKILKAVSGFRNIRYHQIFWTLIILYVDSQWHECSLLFLEENTIYHGVDPFLFLFLFKHKKDISLSTVHLADRFFIF